MATQKLTLLHSNDMHGDFLAEQLDSRLVGGVSRLSGYVNAEREKDENLLYVIAGDMFKGSIIDSEYHGISTIELMNILNPDVVTLGNHEIDYGVAHLLFLEKCARFPIVNANLFVKSNRARLFEPYRILEVGDLKVMFIGVITEEVMLQAQSDKMVGSFIDVEDAAREIAVILDTYKTTDVNYTVLLTHIGFDKDKELAELIDENWGVDIIIGGHTHTLLDEPCVVNGIPIVQAGCGTDRIGRAEITFENGRATALDWKLIDIDEKCPFDSELEETLLSYKNATDRKYGRIVTRFVRELTHPTRIQETELGNLFADLLQEDSSFDLMLLGSGSIRRQKMGPIVRYQDLKECFPYDDQLWMLTVTGSELKRMVRFMLREEAFGGHTEFYQFSRGLRVRYSRSSKEFLEFEFNGAPVADDCLIKIALQDYHYRNFEDFFSVPFDEVKKNAKPRVIATSVTGIVEELLQSARHLDAEVEDRLVVEE